MSGFPTPHKLALLQTVKQSRPRALADEVAVNAVIPALRSFDHHLGTATFYPVFATNWNTTVWLRSQTTSQFTVGFSVQPTVKNTLTYRLTTSGGTVTVSALANTATLTHNLNDATAAFFFTPSWNTNVWVTSKTANATSIRFGVAPTSAQVVYYGRYDLASSAVDADVPVVTAAVRHTHTHGLGHVMADVFTTPTWNTTTYLYDPERTENKALLRFGTLAPSGKTIDVAAGVPLIGEII